MLWLRDLNDHSTLPSPLPAPSLPPPKSMRGKNHSAPIHSVALLLSAIGNASEGNDIHHVMKAEYRNIHQQLWNAAASTAEPGGFWIEHSNTTQETEDQLCPEAILWAQYWGLETNRERSYATNHCIANAVAAYSGSPLGKIIKPLSVSP